ncbi:hypothetical protein SOV_35110 [Sporomusa ovata DSM 2662]|uniref:Histidine kinase/HSP90-like ATPase domain-containing protein n=1 Tax=Sporomusa ovata TaxID=2378 RepID=A0A0U1L664_9FIRM|nr:hypothetical protein [Sporomusa ovata]EQB24660.1 hypothetical protein SOV_6c00740 [Sporomusa ovata DSM 2662]CQR75005.1 hypothetical protein SpAn4DRAFT_4369 [Sporomusa ovata]
MEQKLVFFPLLNIWTQATDELFKTLIDLNLGQELVISLQYVSFLRPAGIIMLLLTALEGAKITKQPVRIVDINKSLLSYLERIDFFKFKFVYTLEELPWWQKLNRNNNSKRIIEITRLECPHEISSVIAKTRMILKEWFPDSMYDDYCDSVTNVLMEICGNSIEHSVLPGEISECYYVLQLYERGEIGVSIAIGDIGIGIRKHITQVHNIEKKFDSYYIERALLGLSGRLDGTGGMGLRRVRQITDNYKGQLFLRSGKGVVKIENNKFSRHDFLYNFSGTQCSINLHPKPRPNLEILY